MLLADFGDFAGAAEGYFVHTVIAVDDERVLHAEHGHGFGDQRNQPRLVDAHHLPPRASGVEQRAHDVQDRARAERLAHGHDGLHPGMVRWGQKEAESVRAQGLYGVFGRKLSWNAKRFEDVRRAAFGGDGAVAVLGYLRSRCCRDEGGGSGDVEAAAGVAAGSAGVDKLVALGLSEWKRGCGLAHREREAGNLGGGFAASRHGAQQPSKLNLGGLAAQDLLHERVRLREREGLAPFNNSPQLGLNGHEVPAYQSRRLS